MLGTFVITYGIANYVWYMKNSEEHQKRKIEKEHCKGKEHQQSVKESKKE